MGKLVTVKAKFIESATGSPLNGDGLVVKLFDKDIVNDDFLGESRLNADGVVTIQFDLEYAASFDSPGEDQPDLYFSIYKYGHLLFQTEVINNVNFSLAGNFNLNEGQVFDAGSFVI